MAGSRAEAAAQSSPFLPELLLTTHTTREAEQLLPRTAQQGHAAGGPAENAFPSLSLPPLGMSPVQTPGRDGGEPWKTGFVPGGTRPSRPSLEEGGSQRCFPRRSKGGTRTKPVSDQILGGSKAVLAQLHPPEEKRTQCEHSQVLSTKVSASTSPVYPHLLPMSALNKRSKGSPKSSQTLPCSPARVKLCQKCKNTSTRLLQGCSGSSLGFH